MFHGTHRAIIIRGVSGSGKSYLANELIEEFKIRDNIIGCEISPHDYFVNNETGEYIFDKRRMHLANEDCMRRVEESIKSNDLTIITDTFYTQEQILPYFKVISNYDISKVPPVITVAFPTLLTCLSTYREDKGESNISKYIRECTNRSKRNVPREAIERAIIRWELLKDQLLYDEYIWLNPI
jgi:adenylate kinase family enzyme